MLIKMLAKGGFGDEGSYLSNRWNKFDLFINVAELVFYFLESLGLNVKVCHVLGLMRLIGRVERMRVMVTVLLEILPMLATVLLLALFVIHIFGVMGVQLWAGQLLNRCFLGEDIATRYNVSLSPHYTSKYDEVYPFICSPDGGDGMQRCRDVPPHIENGQTCTLIPPQGAPNVLAPTVAGAGVNACVNWNVLYNICRAGDQNPYRGAVNFDNIGYAWITIFQIVTLEGWSDIMFQVMDVYSFWSFPFFLLVTIMGSFIMMNVCAVVIATQFSNRLERMRGNQNGRPSAGTVFIAWLCSKLTGCLDRIKRAANRVHHDGGDSGTDDLAVGAQVWMLFKARLERVIKSTVFDLVTVSAVLLSILTMAIEHHNQPKELTDILRITNSIFTAVFVVEMVLKLMALTWTYFTDGQNLFDFGIVIISLWEKMTEAGARLSALRAFRLLRFMRLFNFLPQLRKQVHVLKRAVEKAAPLAILMLFVIFIFSLIGMYLFGNRCEFKPLDRGTDRKSFDTVLWSMVTLFQILTEEDWGVVLYNAMAATSPWAAIYFVAIIVIGNLICLNILVGIVIDGFKDECIDDGSDPDSSQTSGSSPDTVTPVNLSKENPLSPCGPSTSTVNNSGPEEGSAPTNANEDNRSLKGKALHWCKEHEEWSFYVLSPQNRFRIFCQRAISHRIFDYTVMLFVLLNCVTIVMERPGIDPKSKERLFLQVSSYIFSAVFLVEMLFKVLALGLLFGNESYCRSSWNVIDGSLVILSLVHIVVSLTSLGQNKMLGIVKVLRLLRTFRPLRVIKRAPKLRLAVEALIAAVKPMGNVFVICCVFIIFYAILGVQLFKGKFYTCLGENIAHITDKADCLAANYRWERKPFNFDNLLQALLTVFVMYSKDGWVNVMNSGLDAVGVDKQPVMNHNKWTVLFFISFMITSFFLLDMFVGAMVETFHQCQRSQKRRDEGEEQERQQGHGRDTGIPEPEQMPYYTFYSHTRRSIHTLCTSHFLDVFMTVVISISVLVMAIEHYDQPLYVEMIIEYSHYVLTVILIVEVLLKLVAFGGLRFMQNSWDLLDVVVVFVSILSIVLNEIRMAETIPINPSILRVCRVFRLAQVLKAKKIRVLLKTIQKTLLQVGNISLLFMFFFFIYAALGVELFGNLECPECEGINSHINFKHFGMALLALFQVCTGDNWSVIMKDTMKLCSPGDEGCSSWLSWVSPLYFVTFVITAQFVLVNLVVAVIMQAMEDSRKEERDVQPVSSPDDSVQLDPENDVHATSSV
ncbi:voltage-dependent T-type calcium channel subunit alpha-1I-like [Cebidichthys violaceus]|uniref:voltage-dependent T-type calcium channel subunit alpha-1I-like n=1 Tax=Cebidichthys violaceus TaxID=271503 RepID=UPI0035CB2CE3